MKEYIVVDTPSNKEVRSDLIGKVFKSFQAIALVLKPKEKVIVRVVEHSKYTDEKGQKQDWSQLMGFGEVEKINNTQWFQPRQLQHDY
jgi:hypothetical protein